KVSKYNVPNGKKMRGRFCVAAFKCFAKEEPTDDLLRLVNLVGWAIELQLLMASFHSRPHPRCLEVLKLFGDCANYTCLGQALDILGSDQLKSINSDGVSPCGKLASNVDRLRDVTADVRSGVLFSNAESILLKIGEYFQVQDDFLDVYGEETVTGKVGTDIEEGKCSWLIATALENASSEQRDTLDNNYGLKDPGCVNAVRRVFDDLDLPSLYSAYEDQTRTHILEIIESMSTDKKDEDFTDAAATKLPRQLFVEILGIFYRRKK
ncbi:Farnesyl pyrophosphate synthase, partial [Taenia solium]